jgi:hypothetical protein
MPRNKDPVPGDESWDETVEDSQIADQSNISNRSVINLNSI